MTTTTNTKSIKHGEWTFDYNMKKNIFKQDIDSFEAFKFNHDNVVNEYNSNNDKLTSSDLEDFRRASVIHKIARKKALTMLYSGSKLSDLVDSVENMIIKLCQQNPSTYFNIDSKDSHKSGIAFPIGVSINNVVAHDSKTRGVKESRVFYEGDVVKIDIGVHINGRIIDSAFTHIITNKPGIHDQDSVYNPVLEASRDSVFTAIKMAGPDQKLIEISESISEVISSYEVDDGHDIINVKPVNGIGGHNIKQYTIHGGKLILSHPDEKIQSNQIMTKDEIYAIETFASTGYGNMTQNSDMNTCTHFMESGKSEVKNDSKGYDKYKSSDLYKWMKTRNGLPYSSSWINIGSGNIEKFEKSFQYGISNGLITAYPPLYDKHNSVVAQFEHTIHIKDGSVEIFSLGEDY